MGRIVFLTDRSPAEVLPAISTAGLDVKAEPLDSDSLAHLADLTPSAVLVDAEENPDQAFQVLSLLAAVRIDPPVVVIVGRMELDRVPWHEVADELLYPGTPGPEIRLRLAMTARRTGWSGEATLKLGPLSINTDTYQVSVGGRVLDLTYKEFELLRFLVQRSGRVFTRSALLQEVWGYNFYGGTRTVDVHVRRLRAKLGPEYENLIETTRGVGYKASEPQPVEEG